MNLLSGGGHKPKMWKKSCFSYDVHKLPALFRRLSVHRRLLPDFPMKKKTLFECPYEDVEGS
jgi:hypothetical protein